MAKKREAEALFVVLFLDYWQGAGPPPPPAPTFPSDQRRHPRCIVAGGDAREDSA